VVGSTLSLRTLTAATALVGDPRALGAVHLLTDVTNGGLVGDLQHTAAQVEVTLQEAAVLSAIDPPVLALLAATGVDPLGISLDSLLLAVGPQEAPLVSAVLAAAGAPPTVIGRVAAGAGMRLAPADGGPERTVAQAFRESPYTPLKAVVAARPAPPAEGLADDLRRAADRARSRGKALLTLATASRRDHGGSAPPPDGGR